MGEYKFSDEINELLTFLDHLIQEGSRDGRFNKLFQKLAQQQDFDLELNESQLIKKFKRFKDENQELLGSYNAIKIEEGINKNIEF